MTEPFPSVRDQQARNDLVTRNLRLVPWALFKVLPSLGGYIRSVGGSADAVQIGHLRLMRAAELWEPGRGSFASYAIVSIRRGLMRTAVVKKMLKTKQFADGLGFPCPSQEDSATLMFDAVWQKARRERIEQILQTLTYRQREIIKLRFGFDGDGRIYTLDEIGRIFKVTREIIRQDEAKALRKLQHPVRAGCLEALLDEYACL